MTYRSEESRMLEKLMGNSTRVYEFRGTYLECWLEYETSDGESQRSEPARLDASRFQNSVEPGFDILEHMQGWIVIRGHQSTWLDLHLSAQVSWETDRETIHTVSPTTPVSHLDLPKRKTSSTRWQGDLYNPPGSSVVKLPEQVGQEFTIHSYKWQDIERQGEEKKVVRETTVWMKGKLLAEGE